MRHASHHYITDPETQEVKVQGTCTATGNVYTTAAVNPMDIDKWTNGELIQKALPYLSSADREFLISGVDPNYFDSLFPDDTDDFGELDGLADMIEALNEDADRYEK